MAIIDSKPVSIEIKCAATRDKIRPDQLKEKARIEAAGGTYIVVTDMPGFVSWFKSFAGFHIKNLSKLDIQRENK